MSLIRSRFKAVVMASYLIIGVAPAARADIPTIDPVAIAQLAKNAIEQAKQAKAALDTAKEEIAQAKRQYDENKSMISGNDLLGTLLHDPELQKMLPLRDWADIYDEVEEIKEMRKRYKLIGDNDKDQAKFDQVLAVAGVLEKVYEASTKRVEHAEGLRQKLNEANTPQQKQDLQLRYQQEALELQVQQQRFDQMEALVAKRETIENKRRAQAFKEYVNGRRDSAD